MRRSLLALLAAGVVSVGVGARPAVAASPTPVTCGSVITAPGEYHLAGDCGGVGITITASDVTLNLDGHQMVGQVATGIGVAVSRGSRVHLEGPGKITGFAVGIALAGGGDSSVSQVTAIADLVGISATSTNGNQLTNNIVWGNARAGIRLNRSNGNTIVGNTANENGLAGISVGRRSTGNGIHDNTALRNGIFDLADANRSCDNNQWSSNQFVTANRTCIH